MIDWGCYCGVGEVFCVRFVFFGFVVERDGGGVGVGVARVFCDGIGVLCGEELDERICW